MKRTKVYSKPHAAARRVRDRIEYGAGLAIMLAVCVLIMCAGG